MIRGCERYRNVRARLGGSLAGFGHRAQRTRGLSIPIGEQRKKRERANSPRPCSCQTQAESSSVRDSLEMKRVPYVPYPPPNSRSLSLSLSFSFSRDEENATLRQRFYSNSLPNCISLYLSMHDFDIPLFRLFAQNYLCLCTPFSFSGLPETFYRRSSRRIFDFPCILRPWEIVIPYL